MVVPSNWPPRYKAGDTVLDQCIFMVNFEAKFVFPQHLVAEKESTSHCDWMLAADWPGACCTFSRDEDALAFMLSEPGLDQFFYWCLRGIKRHLATGTSLERHPRWRLLHASLKEDGDHTTEFIKKYMVNEDPVERKLPPESWSGISKNTIYKTFQNWYRSAYPDSYHLMATSTNVWEAFQAHFSVEIANGDVVLVNVRGKGMCIKGIKDPLEVLRWDWIV